MFTSNLDMFNYFIFNQDTYSIMFKIKVYTCMRMCAVYVCIFLYSEHNIMYSIYIPFQMYTVCRKQSIIRFRGRVMGENSRTLCYFHRYWTGVLESERG
jgi:hypothetical protein